MKEDKIQEAYMKDVGKVIKIETPPENEVVQALNRIESAIRDLKKEEYKPEYYPDPFMFA